MNNNIKKYEQGFSLLEVLISMVIGLFLLVGITSSYLSSKKSSLVRDEISILEDNGRAALEFLRESIQHAGYRSNRFKPLENPFIVEAPNVVNCGGGPNNVNPDLPVADFMLNDDDGDSIGVIYLGDSTLNTDCNGEALDDLCLAEQDGIEVDAHKIYNTFYVNGDDQLACRGSLFAEDIVLADGVENIQVLYGMDTDSNDNDSKDVERYLNSDDVNGNWGQVVSVQIAILVRASSETKSVAETVSYSLLDTQVDSPTDRFERAVFSTSINLRNL